METSDGVGRVDGGAFLATGAGRVAWLQVARGGLTLNGQSLAAGDGASAAGPGTLDLRFGASGGEVLLFDLPAMSVS